MTTPGQAFAYALDRPPRPSHAQPGADMSRATPDTRAAQSPRRGQRFSCILAIQTTFAAAGREGQQVAAGRPPGAALYIIQIGPFVPENR